MKLPIYLNAMRAFEASARHQSFSGAAKELNVTPAAVGQLVRSLEDWLGVSLFHRNTSGKTRLVPTEVAQRALPDIRVGFDKLSSGLSVLQESFTNGLLTVTVSPALAAKWLLHRIDRFQTLWPGINVRLDTNLRLVDYVAEGIDIGIRYGAGVWAGLVAEKLMEEEVFPVCSPRFLSRHEDIKEPCQLLKHILIHDSSMDRQAGFISWDSWFERIGVQKNETIHGLRINNSAAILQSCVDGHGIALARSVMAQADLISGRLVRLFPEIKCPSPLAYFIVYRTECAALPKVLAFRNWLIAEVSTNEENVTSEVKMYQSYDYII